MKEVYFITTIMTQEGNIYSDKKLYYNGEGLVEWFSLAHYYQTKYSAEIEIKKVLQFFPEYYFSIEPKYTKN